MRVLDATRDLMFFSTAPAVYHCHHFNLFLDQSIDDALGDKQGREVRFLAARSATRQLLKAAFANGMNTPLERLQLAAKIFRETGHGTLDFRAPRGVGEVQGRFLHYGFSWREKYGHRVRKLAAADAFAAGFSAAALELAYDLSPLSLDVDETRCFALRDPTCHFVAGGDLPDEPREPIGSDDVKTYSRERLVGSWRESEISTIANGLRDFTGAASADQRGLLNAFGVYITLHLSSYYNRISFDALSTLHVEKPALVPAFEGLLRESGHVCVFNTFGGILLSPEWEALVAPLSNRPEDIVAYCMAIGRALGFGNWNVASYEPGRRLVVQAPSTYEAVYYRSRHGIAASPREYFFQGAILAIAQLAERVEWTERPGLTQDYYDALFSGESLPWQVEQTRSLIKGDQVSEVVVTRTE